MTALATTVTEALRYRGKVGQWAWVLHRLTGLGVIVFLILHVVDTSWAAFAPESYEQAIREYQSPLFTIGEFFLVASVVFHALNGLRIITLDYKPEWWRYQERATLLVFALTLLILVPTFAVMLDHTVAFYTSDRDIATLDEILQTQSQFVLGFVVILVVALALSGAYGAVARPNRGVKLPGGWEATLWTYMRVSGVLILPLVFGHLVLMHILQGVFDIAGVPDLEVVGTGALNQTGTAVEFVGERWNAILAGVAIWRVYDGLLLALAAVHGFNGLRYIVNDYARTPWVNRALNWAIFFGVVALIAVGTAALIVGVDETAYEIATDMLSSVQ